MKNNLRVIIAGQKKFSVDIYRVCAALPFVKVVGVLVPEGETHLSSAALADNVPVFLELPGLQFDLGITAHYFGIIPEPALAIPSIGWIGYHPSLLPRHRGKNAIASAIQNGDSITGGTVYWLSAKPDEGEIAIQEHVFRDSDSPLDLWVNTLAPLGVKLISQVLLNISSGIIIKQRQNEEFATLC